MKKATAFLEIPRSAPPKRPVDERVHDWREVEGDLQTNALTAQAARCMDCGIAFCHKGCPLGNYVPDWNDLVYRSDFEQAAARLHSTNNFPEVTGRICPAPCEEACVLNINSDPVSIRQIEKQIADTAWNTEWVKPQPSAVQTGKSVAVVGSGPAGLAAAQQLARAGHAVTVFERDDRLGGLLRYGIPDFKMEKHIIDRRVEQLEAEGVVFRTSVDVGRDISIEQLNDEHDAVLLCIGALSPRPLDIPGNDLDGVHFAMDYLTQQNRRVAGDTVNGGIHAKDKRVLILGGGDTGADCIGTAHRQGASEVYNFHYKPAPPSERTAEMPWPWWPMVLRESTSHEEGGIREWSVVATRFSGDDQGRVTHLHCNRVEWKPNADGRLAMTHIDDSEFELEIDLALIAIGFVGPQVGAQQGLEPELSQRGAIAVDAEYQTSIPGVFACGDATRGASLVVWAIWEGREVARQVDIHLQGDSLLPSVPNRNPI